MNLFKKILLAFLFVGVLVSVYLKPVKALADPTLQTLIPEIQGFLNTAIVPFLITIAAVVFIYGVVRFIVQADNEEGRKRGRDFIIWGILGLVLIFVFWGIVNLIIGALGLIPNMPDRPKF